MTEALTFSRVDSQGCTGVSLQSYVGRIYTHSGNMKRYQVMAIVWNGVTDTWAFAARQHNENTTVPCIIRDWPNLLGMRGDKPRAIWDGEQQ